MDEKSEKLDYADVVQLSLSRMQLQVTAANAKTAVTQSENAQLAYDNLILKLSLKYKLSDGDQIDPADGTIKRKEEQKEESK